MRDGRYNTTTHRWFLCECGNLWCRAEFYMRVSKYRSHSLIHGAILVVPGHVPRGWTSIAVDEAIATRPREKS